jgi:hypothetical protein
MLTRDARNGGDKQFVHLSRGHAQCGADGVCQGMIPLEGRRAGEKHVCREPLLWILDRVDNLLQSPRDRTPWIRARLVRIWSAVALTSLNSTSSD